MADSSLRRSSLLMTLGSMSSRLLGMVRTALLTAAVGVSIAADAFTTANSLPNVIFTLAAGGVLNAILVPQLVQAMRRADGGQEFTDKLLTLALSAMLVLTVAVTALAPFFVKLLAGDWQVDQPEAFRLAIAFAYICLPQVFFYALYALLGNVLNARGQFAAYMWAPFVANVVAIAGLLVFLFVVPRDRVRGPWSPQMTWLLAGTATLSVIAQAGFLLIPLWRNGFRYRPRFGFRGVGFGTAGRMAGWAFAGLVISQLPFFVSSRVLTNARALERPGSFIPGTTVTSTAYMIFMLPHAFVTVSIVTALFPRMSAAAADRDYPALRRDYRRGMTMPVVAIVPAMLLILVLARPLVAFLNPGLHRLEELDAIALTLSIMILGILPFGLDLLNYRTFFALDEGRSPFITQLVVAGVGIAVTLGALAFRPDLTAYIYAASIVVSNLASWLTGVLLLRRRLGRLGLAQVVRTGVRVSIAAAVAAAAAWLVDRLWQPVTPWVMDQLSGFGPWVARPSAFGLELLVVAVVFAGLYVAGARSMRVTEIADLTRLVFGRLPGPRPRRR